MNRAELESRHLAELHELAAATGVERYRMLPREELIDALADGSPSPRPKEPREPRRRRAPAAGRESRSSRESRPSRESRQPSRESRPRREPEKPEEPAAPAPAEAAGEERQPRRRRRRRPFARKGGKTVRVHEMLLPAVPGRQVVVYAETRAACTSLLRELAAELSGGRGPDPVALLVDPSPEELADWKREAPKAEIVSAGQERHAEDALAQAARRADGGEAVIFLVDSLSRLAESFGGSRAAKELFDGGQSAGGSGGSLTVVAAVERPAD